jgi:hypothetical protein
MRHLGQFTGFIQEINEIPTRPSLYKDRILLEMPLMTIVNSS